MTYQYRCDNNHEFEVFFKSFSAAKPHEDSTPCDCGQVAKRVPSSPLGFGLYGDSGGYDKPSPTKRFSTKTVSQKTGNRSAVG